MSATAFDPSVPIRLKQLQQWFGGIISQPLREDDTIQTRTPQRKLVRYDAARVVCPSPTLEPHQRMQIYNQQYWWRLLKILPENFPSLLALLGKQQFTRQIAYPYLTALPPDHWSMVYLGQYLPEWALENYRGPYKQWICETALLDRDFNICFIAPHYPPIGHAGEAMEELMQRRLYLQPHFRLYVFDYDAMRFRLTLITAQGQDYWLHHPLPAPDSSQRCHYVIFRNEALQMVWRDISAAEHFLLSRFLHGSSVESACEALDTQPEAIQDEAVANLQSWMEEWVSSGWLTLYQ